MNEESHKLNTESKTMDNDHPNVERRSVYEMYTEAIHKIETEPHNVIPTLQRVQEHVAIQSYFSISSTSSEAIDDIATSLLPYMTVDYHLAIACTHLPVDHKNILTRRTNLLRACDYFNAFLHKLEAYDIPTKEEKLQFQMLVEWTDHLNNDNTNGNSSEDTSTMPSLLVPPTMNRDTKIAQYRQKQQLMQEQERLQSLQLRRRRLQTTISDDEMLDGYDNESLLRTTYISSIHMAKMITYEEWSSIIQELPMITMMIQNQQQQQLGCDDRYDHSASSTGSSNNHHHHHDTRQPQKPLQLTQITQDSMTGQLRIHRQEIQNNTFRPGWNQPTMSLEELADREVHGAIQRQQQQEQSEQYNKTQPRRYEQLVKDGMEDNHDLVDASATLDRNWDVFKDENPRGSGNKRGDVGDRNF